MGTFPHYETLFPSETAAWLHFPSLARMESAFGKLIKDPFKKSRHSVKRVSDFWESGHPQETTVNPNLGKISAGLNFKPADNSTGHLLGHGLFCTVSRLKTVQKNSKRSVWVGEEEVVKGATPFFRDFHEFADFSRGIFWPYFLTKPPQH